MVTTVSLNSLRNSGLSHNGQEKFQEQNLRGPACLARAQGHRLTIPVPVLTPRAREVPESPTAGLLASARGLRLKSEGLFSLEE